MTLSWLVAMLVMAPVPAPMPDGFWQPFRVKHPDRVEGEHGARVQLLVEGDVFLCSRAFARGPEAVYQVAGKWGRPPALWRPDGLYRGEPGRQFFLGYSPGFGVWCVPQTSDFEPTSSKTSVSADGRSRVLVLKSERMILEPGDDLPRTKIVQSLVWERPEDVFSYELPFGLEVASAVVSRNGNHLAFCAEPSVEGLTAIRPTVISGGSRRDLTLPPGCTDARILGLDDSGKRAVGMAFNPRVRQTPGRRSIHSELILDGFHPVVLTQSKATSLHTGYGMAQDITPDGEFVCGFVGKQLDGFLWSEETGLLWAQDVLNSFGFDLNGRRVGLIDSVDSDGKNLFGIGSIFTFSDQSAKTVPFVFSLPLTELRKLRAQG